MAKVKALVEWADTLVSDEFFNLGSGRATRLYFHLVASEHTIRDLEGVEVRDLDQARTEALRLLAEMRQEDSFVDWSGWTLSVTDSSGQVVLSLTLDGGVH